MEILRRVNIEKKELIKASQAVTTMQDIIGEEVTINSAVVYTKTDNDGSTMKVVTVGTEEHGYVTSISPTVLNSVEMICEAYDEKEITAGIKVKIESSKSANRGREFLFITPL